jgi:hypothetical protein
MPKFIGSNEITGWKFVDMYVALIFLGENRSEVLHFVGEYLLFRIRFSDFVDYD